MRNQVNVRRGLIKQIMVYSSDRMPLDQQNQASLSLSRSLFLSLSIRWLQPLSNFYPPSTLLQFSPQLSSPSGILYIFHCLFGVCLSFLYPLYQKISPTKAEILPTVISLLSKSAWQALHKYLSIECIKEWINMEKSLKSILK